MVRGRANRLDSVRRITQVNHGKDTPGIDQVLITSPEERGRLCQQLSQLDLHQGHPVMPRTTGASELQTRA
jgi:RNA-directed DNA polymerase